MTADEREPELDTTRFAPEHDESRQRFVIHHSGGDSVLAYRRPDRDTIDLRHTVVHPTERGHGVGESLVRAALDHARTAGLKVIPTCPFVCEVLAEHPEEGAGLTIERGAA